MPISYIARLPIRRSNTFIHSISVSAGMPPFSLRWLTTGSIRNSFSGNAFSVRIGRGKLRLPLGQPPLRAERPDVRDEAANLFGRQRILERRHLRREPDARTTLGDRAFPIGVGFGRRDRAVGEVHRLNGDRRLAHLSGSVDGVTARAPRVPHLRNRRWLFVAAAGCRTAVRRRRVRPQEEAKSLPRVCRTDAATTALRLISDRCCACVPSAGRRDRLAYNRPLCLGRFFSQCLFRAVDRFVTRANATGVARPVPRECGQADEGGNGRSVCLESAGRAHRHLRSALERLRQSQPRHRVGGRDDEEGRSRERAHREGDGARSGSAGARASRFSIRRATRCRCSGWAAAWRRLPRASTPM